MKNIVDCHLHAITKDEFELYKKTSCADKFVNIRGLYIDEMLDPYDFEDFIDNRDMYFIDSVDLNDVDNELIKVENDIKKYPRIIGVKIYLGYQKYYANDERVYKVIDFADKHSLSVTFHCGEMCDDEGKSVYSPFSDAKYIEELAIKYPSVNLIASHMNWPNFESLFNLCNKYKNVYTCFSGCNDGASQEERNEQNLWISEIINKYVEKYPNVKKKVMYGTDFFDDTGEYQDVSSYIKVMDLLELNDEEKQNILYNNVCDAYNTKF